MRAYARARVCDTVNGLSLKTLNVTIAGDNGNLNEMPTDTDCCDETSDEDFLANDD